MPLKSIFPPPGQQAFLEVLAPYLPFKIDIYHPATNRFGLLRGLPGTYAGQQLPLADVEFYTDAEDAADGGGDLLEDVSKVLPVLWGFNDLLTAQPNGTIPAVEVATAAILGIGRMLHTTQYTAGWSENNEFCWVDFNSGADSVYIYAESWAIEINSCHAAAALSYRKLLEYHFAVGLEPHQYHLKTAANGREVAPC